MLRGRLRRCGFDLLYAMLELDWLGDGILVPLLLYQEKRSERCLFEEPWSGCWEKVPGEILAIHAGDRFDTDVMQMRRSKRCFGVRGYRR